MPSADAAAVAAAAKKPYRLVQSALKSSVAVTRVSSIGAMSADVEG